MMMIATITKLATVMSSVEPISERSAWASGVAVVWYRKAAPVYSEKRVLESMVEPRKAVLITTSEMPMIKMVSGRNIFFMGLAKYNMRLGVSHVPACSFAV